MTALPATLDRTFAAVLFDLDGTLISSTETVERSWNLLADLVVADLSAVELVLGPDGVRLRLRGNHPLRAWSGAAICPAT